MVRHLIENEPRLSPHAIVGLLEAEAKRVWRNDWPSERSISRIVSDPRQSPPEVQS